jgi:ABC-2 type transport system permease protein
VPAALAEARTIFAEELRRSVRRRSYVIVTLLVPALLLLILAVVPVIRALTGGGPQEEDKPAGLVDLSPEVALAAEAPPGFVFLPSREAGVSALTTDETIDELFLIPEDYLTSGTVEWLRMEEGVFSGFAPGPGETTSATIEVLLRDGLASDDLPPEVLGRALFPAAFEQVRIGPDGTPIEGIDVGEEIGSFLMTVGGVVLLAFSIGAGASSLVNAVAEEKENRMIEVILTSAKPLSIMAGKMLAVAIGGLVQIAVWAASIFLLVPLIFDSIPDIGAISLDLGVLVWLLLFFLAGYFFSAVIMAGLGAMSSGVREAGQLSGFIILPMVAPMWFFGVLLSAPNGALARTLSFIPFTAPTTMMVRLGLGESSPVEALASLAVIVLTTVALLWVSARLFRAGLLMYGQRMGPRRLLTALRGAG